MTTSTGPNIRPSDRISFTLLLAMALHALVILGFSFQFLPDPTSRHSSIEIILNPSNDLQRNEEAVYLANSNNQAEHATSQDSIQLRQPKEKQTAGRVNKNNSTAFKLQTIASKHSDQASTSRETEPTAGSRNQYLNTLMSELEQAKRVYAQRPKLHFFDSVSSKSALEADYVRLWVDRIEEQGNLYYPLSAIQQGLSGTLIMSVVIASDGRLISSKIVSSSGNIILNQAAHHVVERSQPFRTFPEAMQSQYDQLMITRTWIYQSDQTFTTKENYD